MTTPARKLNAKTIHFLPDDYTPSSPAICGFEGVWKSGPWIGYRLPGAKFHPNACPKCVKMVA